MRCVVTGVAGFIGSRIAEELLKTGHQVVGIDSLTDYYDPRIKAIRVQGLNDYGSAFTFHQVDLSQDPVLPVLQDSELVFHQAGQPGVRLSWANGFATYSRMNVEATQRLLEAASSVSTLRRFVYASSSSIYGTAEAFPTSETALPAPTSPYGVTKLAAEHLCNVYAKSHGLPTVSLRYFTVYGPGQRPDMAFTRFCMAAATGGEVEIYGDGEQVRDFTFVEDVVAANLAAALADLQPGTVLNVAGGSSVSVNDVLALFSGPLGAPIRARYREAARGDARRTGGDTRLARRLLNWEPQVSLLDGLARQLDWATEQVRAGLLR